MVDPVMVSWRVERASRDRIANMARIAGVSASALIDEVIAQLEADDRGLPVWLDTARDSEELPINPD